MVFRMMAFVLIATISSACAALAPPTDMHPPVRDQVPSTYDRHKVRVEQVADLEVVRQKCIQIEEARLAGSVSARDYDYYVRNRCHRIVLDQHRAITRGQRQDTRDAILVSREERKVREENVQNQTDYIRIFTREIPKGLEGLAKARDRWERTNRRKRRR